MDEVKKEKKSRSGFWKNKQNLLSFAAGMAMMLIISVGVTAAVNPSYLTGTMSVSSKDVIYRMFPASVRAPDDISPDIYLSELILLHAPRTDLEVYDEFTLCDGKNISLGENAALFSVLRGNYGYDFIKYIFGIPNYTGRTFTKDYNFYITQSGLFPSPGQNTYYTAEDIQYVPYNLENYSDYYGYDYSSYFYYGEIVLLKLSDVNTYSDYFIPCEGQTLQPGEYPVLASVFSTDKPFTLPDLRNSSPVDGAEYYICITGIYPYCDSIPAGYMRCRSCGQLVWIAPFCAQCGARQ